MGIASLITADLLRQDATKRKKIDADLDQMISGPTTWQIKQCEIVNNVYFK